MINLKQFSLFLKNIEFLLDIVRALSYNNKVANIYAAMAQMVERVLGKDEVVSSNLIISSIKMTPDRVSFFVRQQGNARGKPAKALALPMPITRRQRRRPAVCAVPGRKNAGEVIFCAGSSRFFA